MDVIKLLQSKNRCLQRLLQISSSFLEQDDLDKLELFQRERDTIFKALDLFERKVVEAISLLPASRKSPELAARASEVLAEKDRLVQAIITKDNELMLRIEQKKTKLVEEISASKKNRELMGKFKSSWVSESGEELDRNL